MEKIEPVFARLDELGSAGDDNAMVNVRESMQRTDLFTSVALVPPWVILP
jgi:hypothetical protein